MSRISWTTLGSGALGVVAGAVAVVAFGWMGAPAPAATGNQETTEAKADEGKSDQQRRLSRLERQVAALGARTPETVQEDTQPSTEVREDNAEEEAQRSPEKVKEARAALQDQHQQELMEYDAETRDSSWADTMEGSLSQRLGAAIDGAKVRMDGADCRSTWCTVTLTWPSRAEAELELELVANRVSDLPCSRQIVLPDDVPEGGAIRTEMTMECRRESGG